MNKLIKIEMERAFKNKMLIISVVIGLVIVGFNIWNEIIPARKTLDKLLEMGKYSGIQLPGLYMKSLFDKDGSFRRHMPGSFRSNPHTAAYPQ